LCSYCGVQWRRSQLRRDASGNLACPDEGPGLDVVSLSEGNARLMRSQQPKVIGPIDGSFDVFDCPPSPGFVNANGPPPQLPNQGPTGPLSVVVNMWLRADVVEQTAGRVSRWPDLSNRGNHVLALTEAARPTWIEHDSTLGDLPTVTSDGASNWLTTSTYRGGAPAWLWVIANPLAYGTGALLSAGFIVLQINGTEVLRMLTNAGFGPDNAGAPDNSWSRLIVRFGATGMDTLQARGTVVSGTSAGQLNGPLTLFSSANGGAKVAASIAEVLITDGPPTATEIADIEAYGVARYGEGLFV
jgi:hypothetical protein